MQVLISYRKYFSLAQLVEYFDILTDNDIEIENHPRVELLSELSTILEIAKLRATRMLIAKILEAYGILMKMLKLLFIAKQAFLIKLLMMRNNMLKYYWPWLL